MRSFIILRINAEIIFLKVYDNSNTSLLAEVRIQFSCAQYLYKYFTHFNMNERMFPINVRTAFEIHYFNDHNDYNVILINFIVLRNL